MDHLPVVPNGTVQGLETVPYVCEKSYDGGPFLTYPIREKMFGMVTNTVNAGSDLFWDYLKRHLIPNKDFEAFCQTWLFFGLISELLGNICTSADFVRSNEAGKSRTISTSRLPALIEQWMTAVEDGSSVMTYEHVAKCLRLTHATLLAAGPEFDLNIKVCIASVGELLSHAANKIFKIGNLILYNKCPPAWYSLTEETTWAERLGKSGWCPSQTGTMTRSLPLQSLYFFASMRQTVLSGRHEVCDNQKCTAYQTDLENYTTQHVFKECRCRELGVDMSILNAVLTGGALPLLRIREAETLDELTVDIVAARPDSCYLALSHVWADGLGNPRANALPRCQLLHLSKLTQSLREQMSADEPQSELLFWCDTLCCPTAPGVGKTRVLGQMKNIYEQATCVLVLDASLRVYESKSMGPEETCARILASGWMRRLWTFQEGATSADKRRLWFQFRDQAVNVRPLWEQLVELYHSDWRRNGLISDLVYRTGTLFNFFRRDTGTDLAMVDAAFLHRSVSVSSDEPLLLGGLLGLDVASILNGSDETRMHRMWSLIPSTFHGTPKDIIFRLGPRLKEEGYRWAASSMLYNEGSNAILHTAYKEDERGTPTERGLMVRLPGYHMSFPQRPKISFSKHPSGSCDNPWNIKLDEKQFYMRGEGASWYTVCRRWPNAKGDYLSKEKIGDAMRNYTNLWVTHRENAFQNESESLYGTCLALLTRQIEESHGVKYVRSYMHIAVLRYQNTVCEMLEAAYRCARQLAESAPAENLAIVSQGGIIDVESPEYKAAFEAFRLEIDRIIANEENRLARMTARQRSVSGQDNDNLFAFYILVLFLGEYAIMGPRVPDSQQWCVD